MNFAKDHPPGVYVRWLALLGFLSYFVYFIIIGIQSNPATANVVYICDTKNYEELTQCQGLDDETTCSNLVDADGNVATCIQSSCGFKLFDLLDVSVAGSSDPYSSEGANDPTTFLSVMSIFYGVVPYLIGFIYIVSFLATGSIVPLTRLVVLGILVVINDEILKKFVVQRRPMGSCLYFKSFGMPSGHSATSIGLLTYVLLEVFVFHPNIICGITCQKKRQGDGDDAYYFSRGYGWLKKDNSNSNDVEEQDDNVGEYSVVSNDMEADKEEIADVEAGNTTSIPSDESNANAFTNALKPMQGKWGLHLYAFLYCLLLFPVPFSRVYLYDHFMKQVLLGSIEGILIASIWYLGVMRVCGVRCIKWWSKISCANWFGLEFGLE